MTITRIGVSRRKALELGACALTGAAGALGNGTGERRYGAEHDIRRNCPEVGISHGEKKDQGQFEALMADNFTFTSAAGDDHISKSAFKTQCWDTQVNFIDRLIWSACSEVATRRCEVSLPHKER